MAARDAAKTHCLRGHEFTEDNTYYHPETNARNCIECRWLRAHGEEGGLTTREKINVIFWESVQWCADNHD